MRASKTAAGYDIFSSADTVVPAKGKAVVPTDISIAVPEDCYGTARGEGGGPFFLSFFLINFWRAK